MQAYTARQPILNRKQSLVGYEIFFRDGPLNSFPDIDDHVATSKLIARTELHQGISVISGGKRAFVNFSEKSLLEGLPKLLPPDSVMIEILETVEPTDEVYQAVLHLKKCGYQIALDDFSYKTSWNRFIKLADLIKFDIKLTPLESIGETIEIIKKLSNREGKRRIRLLAEKVETQEQFALAKKMNFDFFQGYFFCKPEMLKSKDYESNEHLLLSLNREMMSEYINNKKVTQIFSQDANLTNKLLAYVNSGVLPVRQEISSISQALAYLGEGEIRKIATLLVTSVLANDKPSELTRMCCIRGKFAEIIVGSNHRKLADSAFLAGMFSLLDAILDKPLDEIIERLCLSKEIKDGLLHPDSDQPIATSLRIIKLLECANWQLAKLESEKANLNYQFVSASLNQASRWVDLHQRSL